MKKYLKLSLIIILSASVFFGCSYFYLYKSLEKNQKNVDNKQENVPYFETPENCGLHFLLPAGKELLFFLDFEKEIAYIINIDKPYNKAKEYLGYPLDYRFTLDYPVLSVVFDRLGGLELESEGEVLRLTGIQVCDALCRDTSGDFFRETVTAVCKRISQNGFSGEDFIFLIDNTETNLTVPACLYWQDYMSNMFTNAVFVNWVI